MGDVEKREGPDAEPSVPRKKMKSKDFRSEGHSTDINDGARPNQSSGDHISNGLHDGNFEEEVQPSNGKSEVDGQSEEGASDQPGLKDWQRRSTGAMSWIQSQILAGVDPRDLLKEIMPCITHIPQDVSPLALWNVIIDILNEPERRSKLSHVNLMSDVIRLIKESKKILVLTGAGVSVSCGIPDFRSRDGIYARLAVDFPDLPDPQAMFDVSYFIRDPRPFFKFAREIYPGKFKPSRSHRFISLLQKTGRLLRNYTQNIDTLEQVAGITNVIQCHGSFATASCFKCKHQVGCETIREDIFNQTIPRCPKCPPDEVLGILKPDIVFFGESLPDKFHRQMSLDQHEADLLIVIGSSLKVRPVALIPSSLPNEIPQILINREPLPHMQFDVELLGDSDTIIGELCSRLGQEFSEIADECKPLSEVNTLPEPDDHLEKESDTEIAQDKQKSNQFMIDSETTKQKCHTESKTVDSSCQFTEKSSAEQCNDNTQSCTSNCGSKTSEIVENHSLIDCCSTSEQSNGPSSSLTNSVQTELGNLECPNGTENSLVKERPMKLLPNDQSTTETISSKAGVSDAKPKKARPLWKSRWKQSISKRLPNGTFYFDGKHRYVFTGAEVAPEEMESDSSSDEYESSLTSDKSSDDSESDIPGPNHMTSTEQSPLSSGCNSSSSGSTKFNGIASSTEDEKPCSSNNSSWHTHIDKTSDVEQQMGSISQQCADSEQSVKE